MKDKETSYKPFPIGTIRGPYKMETGYQYMVNGFNGWLPFTDRDIKVAESTVKEWADKILAKLPEYNRWIEGFCREAHSWEPTEEQKAKARKAIGWE